MQAIPKEDPQRLVERYSDTVYRLALIRTKSTHDAEDILQEVFLRYLKRKPVFESSEHEKAWFIRVMSNHCKDVMRKRTVRSAVGLDEIEELADFGIEQESGDLLGAIFSLPEKYREVFVLHYLEQMSVSDVATSLGIGQSAVKMRLLRGRELLAEKIGVNL